jgi:hypothetical protein
MSKANVGRGRPKGTGLDDRAQLKAVAKMLAGDPLLKPTTAIKRLGVTDPSAIRRLRDKFRQTSDGLAADVTSATAKRKKAAGSDGTGIVAARGSALQTNGPAEKRASAATKSKPAGGTASQAASAGALAMALPDDFGGPAYWLRAWQGIGMQTFSTAICAQTILLEHMLRLPHLATAMSRNLTFNEFAIALYRPCPSVRTTLH